MIARFTPLILLSTVSLMRSSDVPGPLSVTVVQRGGNVTLACPAGKLFYWYKQTLGHMLHAIASKKIQNADIFINDSRVTLSKGDGDQFLLNIRNVTKEDQASYFCQSGATLKRTFVNGTFLVVNDWNQHKQSVKQSPEKVSVHRGETVTLQCSFLSGNGSKCVHCPAEDRVYWFRAESGHSHPGFIYAHENRSVEPRSCIYSLSHTIHTSEAATYYCAVVTCGRILFGEGTKVETGLKLDRVVLVLGILLACCVSVIFILIFYLIRLQSKASKGAMIDTLSLEPSKDLAGEAEAVNYVSLDFSARKVKRVKGKKNEVPDECFYSVVKLR